MSDLGAIFIPAVAELARKEEQFRNVVAESDYPVYVVALTQLQANFSAYCRAVGFNSFPAYVEDRFGIKPSSLKKDLEAGRAICDNPEVFKDLDCSRISSRSHLNFVNKALSNHPTLSVREALVSMSFREFREWARTPEHGVKRAVKKSSSKKDPIVSGEQMRDYKNQVKDIFFKDLDVFMFGVRSQEDLERAQKALGDYIRTRSINVTESGGDRDRSGEPSPAVTTDQGFSPKDSMTA